MKNRTLLIYAFTFVMLFQESIERALKISFIGYLDEIFVIATFIALILKCTKTKKINLKSMLILGCTIIYFFIGCYSCYINSAFELNKVVLGGFLFVKFFLIVISIMNFEWKESTKETFINAIKLNGKIVICVAVFNLLLPTYYYSIFDFVHINKRYGLYAITSLFYHPGYYGWFMLFVGIIYYIEAKKSKKNKNIIQVIIYFLFSILSLRTKVVIAAIFIILFDLILDRKINIKKLMIAGVALVIIFCCFRNFMTYTYNLYVSDKTSDTARQVLEKNSYKIANEYFPLGVGFGKYGSYFAKLYYSEYYYKYGLNKIYGLSEDFSAFATDTFWPSILGETGYIGLYIYIAMISYIAYCLFKRKSERYVGMAILMLTQTICETFGGQSFVTAPQCILVGVCIGIALQLNKGETENAEKDKCYSSDL